jgi:hypothetical protein
MYTLTHTPASDLGMSTSSTGSSSIFSPPGVSDMEKIRMRHNQWKNRAFSDIPPPRCEFHTHIHTHSFLSHPSLNADFFSHRAKDSFMHETYIQHRYIHAHIHTYIRAASCHAQASMQIHLHIEQKTLPPQAQVAILRCV